MLADGSAISASVKVGDKERGHRYVKRNGVYVDDTLVDVDPELLEALRIKGQYITVKSDRPLEIDGRSYELALASSRFKGKRGIMTGVIDVDNDGGQVEFEHADEEHIKRRYFPELRTVSDLR